MSKTTTVNAIPYPEDTDAPNGPAQIKALAELLDTLKWGSPNLKPTVGVKAASSDLVLTTSYVDVELSGGNLEINPAVASILKVTAVFTTVMSGTVSTSGYAEARGTLNLDGVDQAPIAKRLVLLNSPAGVADSDYASVSQVYLLSLTAGEKHIVKMRGRKSATSYEVKVESGNTRMLYELAAS